MVRRGCAVVGPTLMHPKRVKLGPLLRRPLCARPRNATGHYAPLFFTFCLPWFPSLRHTGLTQFPVAPAPTLLGLWIQNLQRAPWLSSGTKVSGNARSMRMAATYTSLVVRISAFVLSKRKSTCPSRTICYVLTWSSLTLRLGFSNSFSSFLCT